MEYREGRDVTLAKLKIMATNAHSMVLILELGNKIH
jgi:hypothetical protein